MTQSSPLHVGLNIYKDSLAVAYAAQEHGAEGVYLITGSRALVGARAA